MKMGKVYKKRVLAALLALLMSMSQTMPVFASEVPSNVEVSASITEEETSADAENVLEEGDSVYFDATKQHGMQALNNQKAKFLAIII